MEITSKTPPPKVPMRPEAELFDLIGVIRTWAINAFVASADSKTRKQVSITGKGVGNLGVEIVWDDIVCWSEPPRYDDEKSVEIPKCHALFSTVYRNGTDGVQEYNFRTDRSTRSTAEIEITKGFNAHREIGVKLQLPEQILEASAGFSQEISLSKATRQSVDEEMSWGIDAQVEVKPKSIANVQVNVIEKEMNWKFTVNTHLRGRIRAICTDRKRNNAFLMNIESDLGDVVKAHLENLQSPSAKKPTNVNVERTSKTVIITTEGKCAFRFGVKQEVDVTQVEANYPIITTN
nr:LIN 24 (Twenty four) Like family member [Hymenolepis microstoma]